MAATTSTDPTAVPDVDAVVVGAGFAGLYLLHRLRGSGFTARVFEAGGDVGGTWYWNRYPGARCDIESMQYSYQFSEELQQEWEWPERYASQPQILSYIEHVTERFELRPHITFDTRVDGATFDDDSHTWTVTTSTGETVRARHVLLGVGVLSTTHTPSFPALESYRGSAFHTGTWPHAEVDFTGQRVGVVGTGSSAIQAIPMIAEQADHLYVFQRTPNYVIPSQNHALSPEQVSAIKDDYAGFRARAKARPSAFLFPFNPGSALEVSDEERYERFEAQWEVGGLPFLGVFGDLLLDWEANRLVTEYWKTKVTGIVDDPEVAELLIPKGDIFGGKRLCSGTDYFETYNRDNVTLVDVSAAGIDRFTPMGLEAGGSSYKLDAVVFATGFDALTGSVVAMDIAGPDGTTMKQRWSDGPDNYLGMAVRGFPNLFNTQGPGSPGVFATMVTGIEHQSDWIVDCMEWMRDHGYTRVEADPDAEAGWVHEVQAAAEPSLRSKCDSWYMGSNIEGKARVFMPYIGGFPTYVEICTDVAQNDYRGFSFE
ncbi:MAG: NAD(P)/FAD-dependent oxidoreductase [Actinomycetia bacterium]|nr:NAD(P)/FAD-dependent oxidoreductase [Actinomycetes bacterium]